MRGRSGIVNPPELNYHAEEQGVFAGALIEPVKGLSVLIAKLPCQPHNHVGVEAGRIREKFSEMVMVGRLKLVLNDNWSITT